MKRREEKKKKKEEGRRKRKGKAKVWNFVWNTSMETMCLELWYGIVWNYLSKLG